MAVFHFEDQTAERRAPRRRVREVDEKRLARVTADLRRQIDAGDIHGANLKVTFGGELILDLVEGYADKAAGTALQPDSVICTMSVAGPTPDRWPDPDVTSGPRLVVGVSNRRGRHGPAPSDHSKIEGKRPLFRDNAVSTLPNTSARVG